MNVLITGATGFVGSHLCEYLLQHGDTIHGTYLYEQELEILPEIVRSGIVLHRCDLTDAAQMREIVKTVRPERVYHLAAISSVQRSWEGREKVLQINLFGGLNLLEDLREYCSHARVLMVSSGEVYGRVPETLQPKK